MDETTKKQLIILLYLWVFEHFLDFKKKEKSF